MIKNEGSAIASSPGELVKLAGPVSDRVQIRHVILAESVTRRRPHCTVPPASLALTVDVSTAALEKDQLVQVLPRFTLIGREAADSAEETLRIEALFVVLYHMPTFEGITKQNLDAFGKMNGIYNIWPYWREFVQSMTVRMGLPPLTVPSYRPLSPGSLGPPEDHLPSGKAPTKRGRRVSAEHG